MGEDTAPHASTSSVSRSDEKKADIEMTGNRSRYSTTPPHVSDDELVKLRIGDLLHAFKSSIDEFHGDVRVDKESCACWIEKIMTWRRGLLKGVIEPLIVVAVIEALRGEAKEVVKGQAYETLRAMFIDLHNAFPLVMYQQELLGMFKSGKAFKNVTRGSFARILK
ncbi:hypothetical protein COEREDRAFT_11510 [Coemansia reversa NRRL 1564]|uniref:Uncharacterized protein n=1 Tax=Coemansia reversa (strain ATCC 12441 / NRRL 1564) TaxID=763665 RepID=A0A2G5B2X0_COERN|nr:hypothetical protein COEREDRAFT_11510 [Coemansia reversa NRRL 1564]|eukprot:PIA13344.1 hypothetical protein COEREDRAFT_11510 [Coemansia reversa NRRL 1564]